jgi:hypothetical protein
MHSFSQPASPTSWNEATKYHYVDNLTGNIDMFSLTRWSCTNSHDILRKVTSQHQNAFLCLNNGKISHVCICWQDPKELI